MEKDSASKLDITDGEQRWFSVTPFDTSPIAEITSVNLRKLYFDPWSNITIHSHNYDTSMWGLTDADFTDMENNKFLVMDTHHS